jgi:serine/threonine protein kinase
VNGDLFSIRAIVDLLTGFDGDTGIAILNSGIVWKLSFFHSPEFTHRDLKSTHVLIEESMHGKIDDFGNGHFISETLTVRQKKVTA